VDQSALSSISLYPNPTIGEVNILNKNDIKIDNISVFDLSGKLMDQIQPSSDGNIQFDINHLKSGVYIIRINTSQGEIFRKMIKK
jgi:hypothetical protein